MLLSRPGSSRATAGAGWWATWTQRPGRSYPTGRHARLRRLPGRTASSSERARCSTPWPMSRGSPRRSGARCPAAGGGRSRWPTTWSARGPAPLSRLPRFCAMRVTPDGAPIVPPATPGAVRVDRRAGARRVLLGPRRAARAGRSALLRHDIDVVVP